MESAYVLRVPGANRQQDVAANPKEVIDVGSGALNMPAISISFRMRADLVNVSTAVHSGKLSVDLWDERRINA